MKPTILFLDIETTPDVVWVWGVYQQNAIAVKEHWYVLSFAAKWMGSRNIVVNGLDDYKGYKGGESTERMLLRDVHQLLSMADIVVAHNGRDFDVRKLNARFIAHGMQPPSPYKVIDTKNDLVMVAKFSSNRLNWLCEQLGIGRKLDHEGFRMWEGCMNGESKWWNKMKRYNKHDIVLLEELYNILAPWIPQPNAGVYSGSHCCPNPACASKDLEKRGMSRSKTRIYQRYQCRKCGTWSRDVKSQGGTTITRAV